jgi:hypothetical protein
MNWISGKTLRVLLINLLVALALILFIETSIYVARMWSGKQSVGWLMYQQHADLDDPCKVMKTHPILSHVHDDRGQCNIKGGVARDGLVYYGDASQYGGVVVTLGGSTTDGYYQHFSNGETFPYHLNSLVHADGLTVVNGGTGAYGSTQELLMLLTRVPLIKADIKYIVSLDGINDIYGYADTTEEIYEKSPFMTGLQYSMFANQVWIEQGKGKWTVLPNILHLAGVRGGPADAGKAKHKKQGNVSTGGSVKTLHAQRWYANVQKMEALSRSMGAEYFVFLQPTLGLHGVQSEVDPETPDGRLYDVLTDTYLRNLNGTYDQLRIYCAELPYCYDITDVAPPSGDMYSDPRHHGGKGNQLIAERIHQVLFRRDNN